LYACDGVNSSGNQLSLVKLKAGLGSFRRLLTRHERYLHAFRAFFLIAIVLVLPRPFCVESLQAGFPGAEWAFFCRIVSSIEAAWMREVSAFGILQGVGR
jgi:hypothetical protein